MKIRKNWASESNEETLKDMFYSRDETISDVKENYDFRRKHSAEGYTIVVNETYQDEVLIQEHSNPYNALQIDKKMHVPMDMPIDRGSLVDWQIGNDVRRFLVTGDIVDKQAYKSTKIVETNGIIKWIDNTGSIIQADALIGNFTLYSDGVVEGRVLESGNKQVQVVVPANEDTIKLERDDRIVISKLPYKLTSYNDYEMPGLLILIFAESQKSDDDNYELGIANYYSRIANYEISILNGNFDLGVSDSVQLDVRVLKNGVLVNDPELTYEVSDDSVVSIDEDGVVTGLAEGMSGISVSYLGAYFATVEVNVVGVVLDDYSILIEGNNTIRVNQTRTYNSAVLNNGVPVVEPVSWSLYNKDGSVLVYAVITGVSNGSVTIKATNNNAFVGQTVVLKVELDSDPLVYTEKEITITGFL